MSKKKLHILVVSQYYYPEAFRINDMCAEGCDNGGKAYDAVLPADATFTEEPLQIGDQRFVALRASNGLKLVPYCIWGNREPGNEMQVWFKEK